MFAAPASQREAQIANDRRPYMPVKATSNDTYRSNQACFDRQTFGPALVSTRSRGKLSLHKMSFLRNASKACMRVVFRLLVDRSLQPRPTEEICTFLSSLGCQARRLDRFILLLSRGSQTQCQSDRTDGRRACPDARAGLWCGSGRDYERQPRTTRTSSPGAAAWTGRCRGASGREDPACGDPFCDSCARPACTPLMTIYAVSIASSEK